MERYRLDAAPRTLLGKQKVKRLRAAGYYPAIMYGRGMEPTPLQVSQEAFNKMLKTVGANTLVDLYIEGTDGPQTVLVKKLMRDSLSMQLLNIDFHRVSVTDVITNRIPVELVGEPRGVSEGGTLMQPLIDVEVRGVAASLPASLQVDVSHLGIDESLHVSEISVPEGVEIVAAPDEVVAVVHAPRAAVEEPVEPEQITEPELVVKKEEEE
ncbi:MAG TPA: 50S ribosomal protein L25 [Armatimonadota bacterium]|nr:50S ribosomal protein L25 [Armatimonadota bacterium]HOJ21293.1 50S ribosomal protein L25 [Armatimonadota bacterium]HOM81773.1 50S ribosomal protein L25 [Armatimonadota bacterium]HOQ28755.1 50S ribosomal protein L25 [Armatimonadota bacterium]HPO72469.1 50S ribosomal protein L25 [Armatimonadota bacterium]